MFNGENCKRKYVISYFRKEIEGIIIQLAKNRIFWNMFSHFKSNCIVNKHNCHYYSTNHIGGDKSIYNQNRWSIHVLGAYLGIRPGEIYRDSLRNDLLNLLENLPIDTSHGYASTYVQYNWISGFWTGGVRISVLKHMDLFSGQYNPRPHEYRNSI